MNLVSWPFIQSIDKSFKEHSSYKECSFSISKKTEEYYINNNNIIKNNINLL